MTTAAETTAAPATLTRAEAAYAHLASFQRGNRVIVDGREARVVYPQQDPEGPRGIEAAYLMVTGYGTETHVTVRSLLDGTHAIAKADQ
jgi:hypothetical protein